jgi:GTP-binding protein
VKQLTAELTCCSFLPAQFPRDRLPEVAFAGRSNVGKSSLINLLLGGRKIAYTSSMPGKTAGINFYSINRSFYFVDLPGYGFSKAPASLREQWKRLIAGYLETRESLRLTLLLVDSRMPPTELDLKMRDWLIALGRSFTVVLTKVDKLGSSRVAAAGSDAARVLGVSDVVPCSAWTGAGKKEILQRILSVV